LAVVIIGEDLKSVKSTQKTVSRNIKAHEEEKVLELSAEKKTFIKKIFEITDLELETVMENGGNVYSALSDLIIERIAILATRL
jgi:hypothetical protein